VESIKYQEEALKIKIETGDKFGMAATYNNIGGIHEENGDLEKALFNYNRSLAIREEIGDQQGIAGSCGNIGGILIKKGNFPEALKILEKAYAIFHEIGDQQGIAGANNNLGNLYVKQTNISQSSLDRAVDYFTQGLKMANIVGSKEDIKTSYWGLSEAYDKKGNLEPANPLYWKKANEFYKKFIIYRDSLDNEENTRQTVQAQMNYEFEKKEAAQKIEQMKKDLVANEEKRKQNIITVSVIAGLIVVLVFAAFIWRSLSLTRKQKLMIQAQKELVEEKQKEILDSIHYARRIQQAILPKEAYITKQLDRLNK
jgi:tetratricopeptide (TPR) repeat protein